MAKVSAAQGWQHALVVLASTVVGVVVVSCLYWAQTVFIPVALAIFLTFLLSPLVSALQRRRLGRVPSVLLVVVLAVVVLGGVGWAVMHQLVGLVEDLPTYTDTLKNKIKGLRALAPGEGRLGQMLEDLTAEWRLEPNAQK